MSDMMASTFGQLYAAITAALPNASFGEDNDGQIIVYTDMREVGDGTIASIGNDDIDNYGK